MKLHIRVAYTYARTPFTESTVRSSVERLGRSISGINFCSPISRCMLRSLVTLAQRPFCRYSSRSACCGFTTRGRITFALGTDGILMRSTTTSFASFYRFGSILTAFVSHVSDGSSLHFMISTPLSHPAQLNDIMDALCSASSLEKRASKSFISTIVHRFCDICPSGLFWSMNATIKCRFAISLANAAD